MWLPKASLPNLDMKFDFPPSFATTALTLAGAPPATLSKPNTFFNSQPF